MLVTILSCSTNPSTNKRQTVAENERLDSAKWLFYAYTFKEKALFDSNQNQRLFNAIECDIDVDNVQSQNDSIIYQLRFKKAGYNYLHIYDGLPIFGFIYYKSAFKPLTGSAILVGLENYEDVKKDNLLTDSAFIVL